MNYKLSLDEQNKVTVMLVQALWGAISPNFRLVALSLDEPVWKLLFILECDDAIDREEIEDIAGRFDALTLGLVFTDVQFEIETIIDSDQLPVLDPLFWRIVFLRRES